MFNEGMLKELIKSAVKETLHEQTLEENEFLGYWSSNQFKEKTNISEHDYRTKLLTDPAFQKCVYKFEGSRKYYIKVDEALNYLDKHMIRGIEWNE